MSPRSVSPIDQCQHPSLTAYAENAGKIRDSTEAEKLLDSLDDIRPLVSASLYQYVGP